MGEETIERIPGYVPPAYSRATSDHYRAQYEDLLLEEKKEWQSAAQRKKAHKLIDHIFRQARYPNKSGVKMLVDKLVARIQRPVNNTEVAVLSAMYLKNHVKMDSMRGHYGDMSATLFAATGDYVTAEKLQEQEFIIFDQLDYDLVLNPLDDVIGGLLYGCFERDKRDTFEYTAWHKQMFNLAMPIGELALGQRSATKFSMMRNCVGSILWAFCFSGQLPITSDSWFSSAPARLCNRFDDEVLKLISKVFYRQHLPDLCEFALHNERNPGYLDAFNRLRDLTGFDMKLMKTCFFEVVSAASKQVDVEEADLCRYSPSEASTVAPYGDSRLSNTSSSDESINSSSSNPHHTSRGKVGSGGNGEAVSSRMRKEEC